MITVARTSSTAPPAFVSKDVTALEIREDDGTLVRLFLYLPNRDSVMFTTLGDEDFEANCSQVGVPLKIDPATLKV